MIVKNEEECIESCLESLSNWLKGGDELIIVDTGSNDRTKEIIERYRNREFRLKLYDYGWKDDFSDARNFSISKALKDWILILDADEQISKEDGLRLKEILKKSDDQNVFFLKCRNYLNDQNVVGWISSQEDKYIESKKAKGYSMGQNILRVIKNHKRYKFYGRVHESLVNSIKKENGNFIHLDIIIHHYGNLDNKRRKEKMLKYAHLLEGIIKDKDFKDKKEFYIYFEIAKEYLNLGEFDKAIKYFKESIKIREMYISLFLLGLTYYKKGNLTESLLNFEKSKKINPNYQDNYIYIGMIYIQLKKIEEAIKSLKEAIEINDKSALAHFNLGNSYGIIKDYENMKKSYEKVIELDPKLKELISKKTKEFEKI